MTTHKRPKLPAILVLASLALALAGCSVTPTEPQAAPSGVDFDAPSISLDTAYEKDPEFFQVGMIVPISEENVAWSNDFFRERYPGAITTGEGDFAVYPDVADLDPEALVRDLEAQGFEFYPRTLENTTEQDEWFGTTENLVVSITRTDELAVINITEVER